MKMIIGLGNPGEKYKLNRHNLGFMFVDYLMEKLRVTSYELQDWKFDKYANAEISTLSLPSYKLQTTNYQLILAKPQTFMNLSGQTVHKLITNYKLPITNLFIAHDDLDIPLGKFKIQKANGPKMHNGITSIEESLKTNDFWRIRIGVDNRTPENRIPGEAYVLQDFKEEEKDNLISLFDKILDTWKKLV